MQLQTLDFIAGSTYLCRNGTEIKITSVDVGPLSTYLTGRPTNEFSRTLFWRGDGNSMISQEWDLMYLHPKHWRYE